MNFWPYEVELVFATLTLMLLVGWVYMWQRYERYTELHAAVTPLKQQIEDLERVERAFVSRFNLPANGAGYVYLLKDIDVTNYVKIGRTNKPLDRMGNFDVKLPFRTEVLWTIKSDYCPGLEAELHRRYADKRIRGEWFALSPADIDAIKHEYPS